MIIVEGFDVAADASEVLKATIRGLGSVGASAWDLGHLNNQRLF